MRNSEIELQKIADMGTAVYKLPDGRKVAGLILPVAWEYRLSASRVIVTPEGKLIRPTKFGGFFIKPPTYREIVDKQYRELAGWNRRKIIRDKVKAIMTWIKEVIPMFPVIRLCYGGDPYRWGKTARFWEDFYRAITRDMKREDIPELHIWTANAEKLNELGDKAAGDGKVIYISQTQAYRDLPLFCPRKVVYHWEHEDEEGMIREEEVMPKADLGMWEVEDYHVALPQEAYILWKEALPKL